VDPLVAETGQPYAYVGDDPVNAEAVVCTDTAHAYQNVRQEHQAINPHEVYVSGDVHTQTIHGFWSVRSSVPPS